MNDFSDKSGGLQPILGARVSPWLVRQVSSARRLLFYRKKVAGGYYYFGWFLESTISKREDTGRSPAPVGLIGLLFV